MTGSPLESITRRARWLVTTTGLTLILATPALAQEPPASPAADPLATPLDTYKTAVESKLASAYRSYIENRTAEGDDHALKEPTQPIERYSEIHALRAFPKEWVKVLNDEGDRLFNLAATEEPPPESVKKYEQEHMHQEPSGEPLAAFEQAPPIPEGWDQQPDYMPPFADLAPLREQRKTPEGLAKYKEKAAEVEQKLTTRAETAAMAALGDLKTAIDAHRGTLSGEPDAATPWKSLGSPRVDTLADRFLAERYYKGKYAANKPHDMSEPEPSPEAVPVDPARYEPRTENPVGPGGQPSVSPGETPAGGAPGVESDK